MGDVRQSKVKNGVYSISNLLQDPMRNESNRRATFGHQPQPKVQHPKSQISKQSSSTNCSFSVDEDELAAKGFFVPPSVSLKVQCFDCTLLQLDYPLKICRHAINSEHYKLNPECDFVRGCLEREKQLHRNLNQTSSSQVSNSCGCQSTNRDPDLSPSSLPMNSRAVQTIDAQQQLQCDRCVTNGNSDSPIRSVMEQTGRMIIADNSTSRNDLGNLYNNRSSIDFELMKSEAERLKTFFTPPMWSTSFINPDDCANAGFFYLLDGDKVQCAFCRGVAGEWERGDIPIVERRRHFPRCPFVCNLPVGNICKNQNGHADSDARSGSVTTDEESEERGYDVCGPFDAAMMHSNRLSSDRVTVRGAQPLSGNLDDVAKNLSIRPCRGTYNSNMVTELARLKSFKHSNWPTGVEQKPEKLAQAGFYYIGCSDHVKCFCFCCGGGLRNWEGGEDPWVEHAKWFPLCTFLHLNKGDPIVDSVTRTGSSANSSISASHMGTSSDEEEPSVSPPSEPISNSSEAELENGARTAASSGPCSEDVLSNSISGNSSGDEDTAPSSGSKDLEDEVRKLRDARVCKVCMDKEVSVVFLPCGHLISSSHAHHAPPPSKPARFAGNLSKPFSAPTCPRKSKSTYFENAYLLVALNL